MKQMNVLEAQIGVQLFIRTHHGIRATEAGMSFYSDAKFLLQYSEQAIVRARQATNNHPYMIRIGTSMLNPCTVLVDLWNTINETSPQFKMKMVPFHGAEPCPTVYQTLGKDFDVMVGAYERAWWSGHSESIRELERTDDGSCDSPSVLTNLDKLWSSITFGDTA
jgi:hypothetical protein